MFDLIPYLTVSKRFQRRIENSQWQLYRGSCIWTSSTLKKPYRLFVAFFLTFTSRFLYSCIYLPFWYFFDQACFQLIIWQCSESRKSFGWILLFGLKPNWWLQIKGEMYRRSIYRSIKVTDFSHNKTNQNVRFNYAICQFTCIFTLYLWSLYQQFKG